MKGTKPSLLTTVVVPVGVLDILLIIIITEILYLKAQNIIHNASSCAKSMMVLCSVKISGNALSARRKVVATVTDHTSIGMG